MKNIIDWNKNTLENHNIVAGYNIEHLVIELDDLEYLTLGEQGQLLYLLEKIQQGRKGTGKTDKTHIVVDSEKKYIKEIVKVIKSHNDWGR